MSLLSLDIVTTVKLLHLLQANDSFSFYEIILRTMNTTIS